MIVFIDCLARSAIVLRNERKIDMIFDKKDIPFCAGSKLFKPFVQKYNLEGSSFVLAYRDMIVSINADYARQLYEKKTI